MPEDLERRVQTLEIEINKAKTEATVAKTKVDTLQEDTKELKKQVSDQAEAAAKREEQINGIFNNIDKITSDMTWTKRAVIGGVIAAVMTLIFQTPV